MPLERIAESVRPGTALVAVSAAQSADGRIADLPALRAAAREHGARTYVDASQAAGWLPTSTRTPTTTPPAVGFKWLVCPRGRRLPGRPGGPGRDSTPLFAGLGRGRAPLGQLLRPRRRTRPLRPAVRREPRPLLLRTAPAAPSHCWRNSASDAVRAHDLALADRFRAGLAALGHQPVPSPGSPIVVRTRTRPPAGRVERRRGGGLRPRGQPARGLPPVQHVRRCRPPAGRPVSPDRRRGPCRELAGSGPRRQGDEGAVRDELERAASLSWL